MIEHNNFKKYLQQEILELQKLQKQLEVRLADTPTETLHILQKSDKNIQYYVYDKNRKRKYLSSKEKQTAHVLAQKSYDQKVLAMIEARMRYGKRLLEEYENSISGIFQHLSFPRKTLVTPIIPTDEQFVEDWYRRHPGMENPYPFHHTFFSERGETVRSKSEKILADLFLRKQLPYIYEPKIILRNGQVIYPDFLLLNVPQRKTFVYEHFGMMDNPQYAQKAIEKITMYSENGYWYGDTFLFSLETTETPLNTKNIEELLHKFIIS